MLFKKVSTILLSTALLLAMFTGCTAKKEVGGKDMPTKVVFGLVQDPSSITPFSGGRDYINYIQNMCYQKLCQRKGFSPDMDLIMIKSYKEVDSDTITMELYDYIKDSDGNPIKAEDVAFSFKTALESKNYNRISPIKSVTVIGEHSVQMDFKKPLLMGELENCLCETYVVSQKAYEASSDKLATKSVGTGPYVVTEFVPGVKVILEKNKNYWQKPELNSKLYAANVDTIEFDVIRDASSLAIALQTGNVDMTTYLKVADIKLFQDGGESADKFNVVYNDNGYLYTIMLNCDAASPLSNLNLRLAIAHAIDRSAIGKSMYGDAAFPVYALANPNYVGYNKDWEKDGYYEYNMAKAKEYLQKFVKETNTDLSKMELRIVVGTMAAFKTIAEFTQANLSALGLNVNFTQYDAGTSSSMRKDPTKWDISVYTGLSYCYITDNWDLMFDANDYAWKGSINFVFDKKLQDMLTLCKTRQGFTQANLDAFNKYIEDNCFMMGAFVYKDAAVVPSYCTETVSDNRGMLWPNACTYDWSNKK